VKALNRVMMPFVCCQMMDLKSLSTLLFYLEYRQKLLQTKEIGVNYSDKIVRPVTRTRIRDNAVYYDAVALYSTKGMNFSSVYLKQLKPILNQEVWF
jgi:hypothetical protein